MYKIKTLVVLVSLLGNLQRSFCQSSNQEIFPEKKVLGSIENGKEVVYELQLEAGQFALLDLMQQGIDLEAITYAPDGIKLDSFDTPNGSNGSEVIFIDATHSGKYQLKIKPLGAKKTKKSGSYSLKWISLNDKLNAHLDQTFNYIGERNHLPGFYVSFLDDKNILYKNAQGFANIKNQIPYTENTIQQVESISKTFIAISIMMLVEQGKLNLDEDINTYLPFKISNPHLPNSKITLRHLATHTATINDRKQSDYSYWMTNKDLYLENRDEYMHKSIRKEMDVVSKNKPSTLESFLKDFFLLDGKYYSKKNFFKTEPGQKWYYSNIGASLAAYVVEKVSGRSYDQFVLEQIIKPLNLQNTSWSSNSDKNSLNAGKYDGGKIEYPRIQGATYPEGGLYLSAADLSTYLMHWIKAQAGFGSLLKNDSYQEIMKVHIHEKSGNFKGIKNGLFWWIFKGNRMGHNGGSFGSNANMFFFPDKGIGYISLTNMSANETDGASEQGLLLRRTMNRYAKLFVNKE